MEGVNLSRNSTTCSRYPPAAGLFAFEFRRRLVTGLQSWRSPVDAGNDRTLLPGTAGGKPDRQQDDDRQHGGEVIEVEVNQA